MRICRTLITASLLALAGCASIEEMKQKQEQQEAQRQLAEQRAIQIDAANRKAEEQRALAEIEEKQKRYAAQQYAEAVSMHRKGKGLVVNPPVPACLMKSLFSCSLYSSDVYTIRVSYLNDTKKPIQDIKLSCVLVAQSGTPLGKWVTETVYARWEPGDIKEYSMNVPAHNQASSAKCARVDQ